MKTENSSLKKAVSLCLIMLCIFNSKLYPQIIYTDIPDATPNVSFSLDLNNDLIVDFRIEFELGDKVICKPQNNNAYSGDFVDGDYLPWALSQSVNICDLLITWYGADNAGTMAWGTNTGYWIGATDKYLALKLIEGTNTYYGWARLGVTATSSSFTIKDYAYESTPDACIQSGQITTGISENIYGSTFSVFPNPFSSTATIHAISNFKNATITIYNTFGRPVKQVKNISGQTFSFSRNNIPAGAYLIQVTEENKIIATDILVITD